MMITAHHKCVAGVATTELKVALTGSLILSLVLWATAIQPLLTFLSAADIKTAVNAVEVAAKNYYGKDIILTHCLTPTQPISTNALISQKLLNADLVIGKNYQLSVSYVLQHIGSWSRASLINVDVTFTNANELQRVTGFLDGTLLSPTQLRFTQPVDFDVDWRSFNPATGCLN